MTLTKSENSGYGFSVVVNKIDTCLYVDEILNDPALSDGRLRRGDRIIMVQYLFEFVYVEKIFADQCNLALAFFILYHSFIMYLGM